MPVQVNLPTVLRSHAGGAKTVSVEGSTVGEVLTALVGQYPGLSGQVIDERRLAAQVRQRLPERRRRAVPVGPRTRRSRTSTRSPSSPPWPAGPSAAVGPAAAMTVRRLRAGADREHPAGRHQPAEPQSRRPHPDQARGTEPGRLGEGPDRPVHDRGGGEGRGPEAGPDADRALLGQHRHRHGPDLPDEGLPPEGGAGHQRLDRATPAARGVGGRDHRVPGLGGVQRRGPPGPGPGRRAPRVGLPLPVRQPGQPEGPLRGHRTRDLA